MISSFQPKFQDLYRRRRYRLIVMSSCIPHEKKYIVKGVATIGMKVAMDGTFVGYLKSYTLATTELFEWSPFRLIEPIGIMSKLMELKSLGGKRPFLD